MKKEIKGKIVEILEKATKEWYFPSDGIPKKQSGMDYIADQILELFAQEKETKCSEAQRHIEDCPECRKVLREYLEDEEIARNSIICEQCRNELLKKYQKPKQAYKKDTIKVGKIINNTC